MLLGIPRRPTVALVVAALLFGLPGSSFAGRGGGGGFRGGGGGFGGGGGGFRGGGANFGGGGGFRPAPSGGAMRPAGGFNPNVGGGAARPGVGNAQNFNRPVTGAGGGNFQRPATAVAPRIEFGGGRPAGGVGNLPGMAARPAIADRPGGINRPGAGVNRPATLPGLGNEGFGRPVAGSRENILANRPDRVSNLRDQVADRRGLQDFNRQDWQNWRNNHPGEWQNWRDGARDNWRNWYNDYHGQHGDWYHGSWNGNWGNWWNHMWDDHTAAMVLGTTFWGLNRLYGTFGYGGWGYMNPYYDSMVAVDDGSFDYGQPLVDPAADYAEAAPVESDGGAIDPSQLAADVPAPGMAEFDAARNAFYQGQYDEALAQLNVSLQSLPGDAVVHEFRALVLFAQAKYRESCAAIYAVLSVGPGWDWTTLSSLYPSVDVYTTQLRALEAWMKQNPKLPEGHFLLAYHYMSGAHNDAALRQFRQTLELTPDDPVVKQFIALLGGPDETAAAPTPAPPDAQGTTPASDKPEVKSESLQGQWSAKGPRDESFALSLDADGAFVWTYSRNGRSQTVKGVWAIDGNMLALEPDSGGVMMAEVTSPADGRFSFKMVGGPRDDPGLTFAK